MIIFHRVVLRGQELDLTIEVGDVHMANDSVGWTQVGSYSQYDQQDDYIEDYEIESISLEEGDDVHVLDKYHKDWDELERILLDDEEFYWKMMDEMYDEAAQAKAECQIEQLEYERESRQNYGLGR
jgi:hypothetical protein